MQLIFVRERTRNILLKSGNVFSWNNFAPYACPSGQSGLRQHSERTESIETKYKGIILGVAGLRLAFPVIQGIVMLAGLYLGLSRGFLSITDVLPDTGSTLRAMILPAAFALLSVNLLLKLYMG